MLLFLFIEHVRMIVWSVAANDVGLLIVGTAGTRGVPPWRVNDLATGTDVLDLDSS